MGGYPCFATVVNLATVGNLTINLAGYVDFDIIIFFVIDALQPLSIIDLTL